MSRFPALRRVGFIRSPETGAAADRPETNRLIDAAIEHIDERVASGLERDRVGGVTVGIVLGNEQVWTNTYGYSDEASATPASQGTTIEPPIEDGWTAHVLERLGALGVCGPARGSDRAAWAGGESKSLAPMGLPALRSSIGELRPRPDADHAFVQRT